MADFVSWVKVVSPSKRAAKFFHLTDDIIESQWPGKPINNYLGHSSIFIYYRKELQTLESRKWRIYCQEDVAVVPRKIAIEINKGHMVKMARAGGMLGAHYNKIGRLNSPWWMRTIDYIESFRDTTLLDGHEDISKLSSVGWPIINMNDKRVTKALNAETRLYAGYTVKESNYFLRSNLDRSGFEFLIDCRASRLRGYVCLPRWFRRTHSKLENKNMFSPAIGAMWALAIGIAMEVPSDDEHLIEIAKAVKVWRAGYAALRINGRNYIVTPYDNVKGEK